MIAHLRWSGRCTEDGQEVRHQTCDVGGGHRRAGEDPVAPVGPCGCDVGSGGKDVDRRPVVGVERPTISDVCCSNGDRLGSVRGASQEGIRIGVTL